MKNYPFIQAWGHMLHSFDYYIEHEIELAKGLNAPFDTIYFDLDGKPITFGDIKNVKTQEQVIKIVSNILSYEKCSL
jgi:GGDEF domain-containing protein